MILPFIIITSILRNAYLSFLHKGIKAPCKQKQTKKTRKHMKNSVHWRQNRIKQLVHKYQTLSIVSAAGTGKHSSAQPLSPVR